MNNSSLSPDELLRYSRQLHLKELGLSGQEKLKNARVLCVGLGGLGSPLLLYLASAGIGRLGLVDADNLELSNLQRQVLYRQSQVSNAKTTAAAAQILALNSNCQVDSYCEKLSEHNVAQLISQYDIVADCSDNFYTNYLIHDQCYAQSKPYVYASVSQFKGYCSLFSAQEGPCLRCLFPNPEHFKAIPNCNEAGILGVVPGFLGIIQATEIIKWIVQCGQSLKKRLLIADLLQMNFKTIELVQNPDCPLCVHHQTPASCTDWSKYSITANEMHTLLKNPDVTLIDVRTQEEHEAHNLGGKWLSLDQLPQRMNELNPNLPIILYCRSGVRSIQALTILVKAGFVSVSYLMGGMINH